MILRALGRLIGVPLSFLIASAAALAVLLTLGLERFTHATTGFRLDEQAVDLVFSVAYGFVGIATAATVVPAILVVIVGEVARIRSWLYYVAGGGLAVAVLPLIAQTGQLGADGVDLGSTWPVFATAGFAGGLVYWLLAGRTA